MAFRSISPSLHVKRAYDMKLTLPSLLTTSVILGSLALSSAKPVKKQTPLEPAFVLVGDSTTANNTVTPNSGGWGNGFCASLRPGVSCSNYGSNGATTGTIVDRGIYADALGRVKEQIGMGKAVFVTLQFGHSQSWSSSSASSSSSIRARLGGRSHG